MDVFNVENKCVKCGYGGSAETNAETNFDAHGQSYKQFQFELKRTCKNCNYQWREKSLDAPK